MKSYRSALRQERRLFESRCLEKKFAQGVAPFLPCGCGNIVDEVEANLIRTIDAKRQDRLAFIVALGDSKQAPLIANRQEIER